MSDLLAPRRPSQAFGHNHCPQTLFQCCVNKPHQPLQLPQCCGFITSSQGCCVLSKELNWGTVFKDSGHISLSSLFSPVLCPFSRNTLRLGFLCREMGAEGRGLQNLPALSCLCHSCGLSTSRSWGSTCSLV